MHSATGEKSTKPGLPVTVLNPIRGMFVKTLSRVVNYVNKLKITYNYTTHSILFSDYNLHATKF